MKRKRALTGTLFIFIGLLILSSAGLYARGPEIPFPKYGSGPIEVRIYTDYFCPPCRAMEPSVEPVLHDLLERKIITLIFIDVPFHRLTPLYAKYFLYALKMKNDPGNAFRIRNTLIEVAANGRTTSERHIRKLFKSREIAYTVFETRPVFDRYNTLINEDGIRATPTCIIIRKGEKMEFAGAPDIIAALKRLQ